MSVLRLSRLVLPGGRRKTEWLPLSGSTKKSERGGGG